MPWSTSEKNMNSISLLLTIFIGIEVLIIRDDLKQIRFNLLYDAKSFTKTKDMRQADSNDLKFVIPGGVKSVDASIVKVHFSFLSRYVVGSKISILPFDTKTVASGLSKFQIGFLTIWYNTIVIYQYLLEILSITGTNSKICYHISKKTYFFS